jgi:hypothetical protein
MYYQRYKEMRTGGPTAVPPLKTACRPQNFAKPQGVRSAGQKKSMQ